MAQEYNITNGGPVFEFMMLGPSRLFELGRKFADPTQVQPASDREHYSQRVSDPRLSTKATGGSVMYIRGNKSELGHT